MEYTFVIHRLRTKRDITIMREHTESRSETRSTSMKKQRVGARNSLVHENN